MSRAGPPEAGKSEAPPTRARTRTRAHASPLLELPADLQHHILANLDPRSFYTAGSACMQLRAATSDDAVASTLTLDSEEPPAFTPAREALLRRVADAGHAAACYRLGLAYAYHPRPTQERPAPLRDSAAMLNRAIELGSTTIAADAAYELWLLTRRLPTPTSSDHLLHFAADSGSRPARFAANRTRSSMRRPGDFHVSVEFAVMQRFLVAAFEGAPLDTACFSVCRNPTCGRWGVRAREVRRQAELGLPAQQAPPGLPRCQGLHGKHCRTRYCSRFCQAQHWPEHMRECSRPEPVPDPPQDPPEA